MVEDSIKDLEQIQPSCLVLNPCWSKMESSVVEGGRSQAGVCGRSSGMKQNVSNRGFVGVSRVHRQNGEADFLSEEQRHPSHPEGGSVVYDTSMSSTLPNYSSSRRNDKLVLISFPPLYSEHPPNKTWPTGRIRAHYSFLHLEKTKSALHTGRVTVYTVGMAIFHRSSVQRSHGVI